VKTVGFSDGRYIGDPVNAVKIFNEKEVDELMVLDIDATVLGRDPDYRMIEHLAAESRMPLCYGGGVKTADQASRIVGLGVEKVALSSAAIDNPVLMEEIASSLGAQTVVGVLDARRKRFGGGHQVWTHNGTVNTKRAPAELASEFENRGAGEVVLNSIDNDGEMGGYDLDLVRGVWDAIKLPMSVVGGAGSVEDIGDLLAEFGVIGAGVGSLFVFKGAYKAVLINYPSQGDRDQLCNISFASDLYLAGAKPRPLGLPHDALHHVASQPFVRRKPRPASKSVR